MFLSDIIINSAEAALQFQLNDGSFPPGMNGPYRDPETPVRNTAHWLITMLKAYDISGDAKFRESAWMAVKYILSPVTRPMSATFFCRKKPDKDFCNGLMGQAWIIEALAISGSELEDESHIELARNVFMMHPFDQQAGLWRRVNVDGSYNSFDMTFNHQLWFAAAGAMLCKRTDDEIASMIKIFMDRVLETNLRVDSSGRIIHTIAWPSAKPKGIRKMISYLRGFHHSQITDSGMVSKEIGYHAFNMYAFSILKRCMSEHPLWKSDKFLSTLGFMDKSEFIQGLENNMYGYSYNLSGFETAFTIQEFRSQFSFSKTEEWWMEQQLQRSYDPEMKMLNRSTDDQETLSARLYEATRIRDMKVRIK
ncbi:MAG: agl cluster protein AglQ [Nitrospiraceae bacterium]|nr:MAG: agl cluster protein AglQ [Nitrospiraceae bacterium]